MSQFRDCFRGMFNLFSQLIIFIASILDYTSFYNMIRDLFGNGTLRTKMERALVEI